jgi:hypothetical protein
MDGFASPELYFRTKAVRIYQRSATNVGTIFGKKWIAKWIVSGTKLSQQKENTAQNLWCRKENFASLSFQDLCWRNILKCLICDHQL